MTFSSSNFRSTCSSLFRFRSFLIPFPLSLSFSPLVSRSCLPFSCGFFLSLRRERGRGRGRGESSGPASISRSRTGRLVNRADHRILSSSRRQLRPCRSNSMAGDLFGFHRRVGRNRAQECAILREKISPAVIVLTSGCARIQLIRSFDRDRTL